MKSHEMSKVFKSKHKESIDQKIKQQQQQEK